MRPYSRLGKLWVLACLPVLVWVSGASCIFDSGEGDDTDELWQESLEFSRELQEATVELWRECAKARGATDNVFPPEDSFHISPGDEVAHAMGFARPRVDAHSAATFGYLTQFPDYLDHGLSEETGEILYGAAYTEGATEPSPPGTESISYVEWDQSVTYHTEGCVGETYDLVYGDSIGEFLDQLLAATVPIDIDIDQDSEFLAAQEQWVGCMNDAGYERINSYRDTFAAVMSLDRGDTSQFTGNQVALAGADAACAEEHDINATNYERFTVALEEADEDYRDALRAYNEYASDIVQHANDLVDNDEHPQ